MTGVLMVGVFEVLVAKLVVGRSVGVERLAVLTKPSIAIGFLVRLTCWAIKFGFGIGIGIGVGKSGRIGAAGSDSVVETASCG
jgi:hypothetical protein